MSTQRISISATNLALAGAFVFLALLLWQLKSLLVILAIAVVIAAALAPVVDSAERLGMPRFLAILLVYLILLLGSVGLVFLVGPPAFGQIQDLSGRLSGYLDELEYVIDDLVLQFSTTDTETLESLTQFFDLQALLGWAIRSGQELLVRSYGLTRGLIGGLVSTFLAILLSAYMLSGARSLLEGLISLFPAPWNERLQQQVVPVSKRMGVYIQGRVLVSAILGVAVSIGLRFLGLEDFALGLGAIASVTNLIPFFGPVIGAVPALIVAIGQGGVTFFWVLLLFVILQNVETYVLDPLLVGNSVRVHPLYQLLAVLGGTQVLGIVGALIVPPWIAGGAVLLENLYLQPKKQAEKREAALASSWMNPEKESASARS